MVQNVEYALETQTHNIKRLDEVENPTLASVAAVLDQVEFG